VLASQVNDIAIRGNDEGTIIKRPYERYSLLLVTSSSYDVYVFGQHYDEFLPIGKRMLGSTSGVARPNTSPGLYEIILARLVAISTGHTTPTPRLEGPPVIRS
jgi:hypothetical protein